MRQDLASRIATRFIARTATVVHRDGDLVWGWFDDSSPRMHLTLLSPGRDFRCVAWLEDRGRPIFSASGCPSGSTLSLRRWLWDHREEVERLWIRFMAAKGWFSVRIENDVPVLVCYPGELTEFTRPIDRPIWQDRELR